MANQQLERQPGQRSEDFGWMMTVLALICVGLIAIIIYSTHSWRRGDSAAVLGVSVLAAGGCLLLGGLVGFLFGIPRSLQQDRPPTDLELGGATKSITTSSRGTGYRVNTNLEQISDWLTKILVGVGLTQLDNIPDEFRDGAEYLGAALGKNQYSDQFALWLVLYFLSCGFFFVYLWTRLFLAGAFVRADVSAAIISEVRRVQADQGQIDATALSLTYKYLNPELSPAEVDIGQLKQALKLSQASIRVQVFERAREVRRANWRTDKALMERVIPIFEALIESDPEKRFHRNYGQLGYALKDQRQPRWAEAEAAFTTAIGIRGPARQEGWAVYEANRALCRIMQDKEFQQGKPSTAQVRAKILGDLQVAYGDEFTDTIFRESQIGDWISLNSVTPDELSHNPTVGANG
jgi:tetratricopeptide (TPR) repeat protein